MAEYSRFYLKYIENGRAGGLGTWIKLSTQPTSKSWSGPTFESICLKHIILQPWLQNLTMKQLVLLSLSLLFTLNSFCQTPQDQLLKAFNAYSHADMDSFFDTWKKNTIFSHAELESMDDTVQNIYQVYQKYYNPNSTDSIHKYKYLGIYQIKELKYLLLQNTITYGIVDTLDRELLIQPKLKYMARQRGISMDSMMRDYEENTAEVSEYLRFQWPTPERETTINNFRPQVSFSEPGTLILTKAYNDVIWNFLTNGNPLSGKVKERDFESSIRNNRLKFIEQYFRVWNGIWSLASPPYITSITFDKKLENALVRYDHISSGGYGYLKKINGDWKVIDVKMIWQH